MRAINVPYNVLIVLIVHASTVSERFYDRPLHLVGTRASTGLYLTLFSAQQLFCRRKVGSNMICFKNIMF